MPGAEEDRIDLGNRREQRALAAPDQVARLHLGGPDDPADRRSDVRVAEVECRIVDRRLLRVHLGPRRVAGGHGIVEFLLADRLFGNQGLEAGDIVVRLLQAGIRVGKLGFGFGQRRFQRLRIDEVEGGALLDERTLGEQHLFEVALDPGANLHVLRTAGLPHQFHEDRDVLLNDVGDVHLGRRCGSNRLLLAADARTDHGAKQNNESALHRDTSPLSLDQTWRSASITESRGASTRRARTSPCRRAPGDAATGLHAVLRRTL